MKKRLKASRRASGLLNNGATPPNLRTPSNTDGRPSAGGASSTKRSAAGATAGARPSTTRRTDRAASPLFHVGAQIELERPCIARLLVERPVRVGDVFRIHDAVLVLERVAFGERRADELRVDRRVHDDMRHV